MEENINAVASVSTLSKMEIRLNFGRIFGLVMGTEDFNGSRV